MKNKQTETKFKPALYLALVLGSIFLATAAAAQTTAIEGVVRGPGGKPMKNADVRLESKAKAVAAQTTKTDTSGRYRFANVGVGKYRVTILSGSQVQGFIDNVNTSNSKAAKVDFDIKGAVAGQAKKTKHLVWVPNETGTHLGGHWVEEDNASGSERVEKKSGAALQNMQRASGTAATQPGG